jgi:agmatine deiminase
VSRLLSTTPRADGFRMPGAIESKKRCWMIWPERTDGWVNGAKPAQRAYARLAAAIATSDPVTMCASERQFKNARAMLPAHIRVVEMSTDDAWMRDCGPNFVVNDATGEVRGVDWIFNAWGGLESGAYFPWDADDQVARKVLDIEELDRYRAPIVAEGGALQCDGEGTLITTRQCLLNSNRKVGNTDRDIEQALQDYLNVEKIIWLPRGCPFDTTDGHIDDLAVFTKPGEVLLTWTEDRSDPQYEISQEALEVLSTVTDARGRRLDIHKVIQPNPICWTAEEFDMVDHVEGYAARTPGERIAATYINYYIGNRSVFVPTYEDPNDLQGLAAIQQCLPQHKVVGVPGCRDILLCGGSIGCITQPQYAGGKRLV